LPDAVEPKAIPIIFADDTSTLVTSPDNNQFQKEYNTVFCQINKWFKDNLIFLSFNKMYFIQFNNKSIGNSNIQIMIEDKQVSTVNETKFLGLSLITLTLGKGTLNTESLN
jgi:hypothetical protein